MKQIEAKAFARTAGPAVAMLILVGSLLPFWRQILQQAAGFSPHLPDLHLWNSISAVLQFHIVAALSALAIGTVLMLGAKGRGLHKALGWSWVAAMTATAISSLFITGLNGDFYSLIHVLSGWTLVALPMGIYAIRRRDVAKHRRTMGGMFYGGLVVAGAFTFIPGRFMFQLFFG